MIDLRQVSSPQLETLAADCAELIRENRADILEFELFVNCQYELAQRGAKTRQLAQLIHQTAPVAAEHIKRH